MPRKRWTAAIQDRDEQRQIKRQAVIRTGARLFHARGYEYTSLADIADELGVTKPSLYYYVKNKDEILFDIVQQSLDVTAAAFHRAERDGGTALHKLRIFFSAYIEHLFSDLGLCATSVDIRGLPSELGDRIRHSRTDIDHRVRSLVGEGIKDGSIGNVDAMLSTFFLFGASNWIGQWYRAGGSRSREDVIAAFDHFLTRALRP